MRFTVVWSRTATHRLAELWLKSNQQVQFTDAANRIDQELSSDPKRFATALGARLFMLDVPPLVVVFSVNEQDCQVVVEEIKELGPLEP